MFSITPVLRTRGVKLIHVHVLFFSDFIFTSTYAKAASCFDSRSMEPQFVPSRRMDIYDPIQQIGMWGENFNADSDLHASISMIVQVDNKIPNKSETASHEMLAPSNKYDQEATKPIEKIQRRLAQNREAARKSRLRKKAYVQQLENSRLKLIQLEQELAQIKQQGVYMGSGLAGGHLAFSAPANSGIAAFETEYGHWMDEQSKQICALRTALNAHISVADLQMLVETGMNHYSELFRMKSAAAKADVFYVMSGMWKTPAEQFFSWIGGFRPSELLKVLLPQLDSLTEQQFFEVCNLKQSCQQAEDALSQGMEKLREIVAVTVADGRLGEGSYSSQVNTAMEKVEALVNFVNQADHIRQETLQQMSRILTVRQTARGLLALGEYLERLRALSTLRGSCPREPA
ncbi:hypothetical protein V6N12_003096 [Hibiscus sabdariffa]|uniref:Transcription factor TGA1-like n=1 Tax=Hibiscus sabdariffa TaxID=183260 RepID=A0ABR2EAX0_9ROSI